MSFNFETLKGKARLVFTSDAESGDNDSESDSQQTTPDRLEELSEYCPQLTFQQRLIGFAASFTLGYMIAFFSFRFFVHLVEGNPIPFACNYTLGHILQLLASTFLCGPKRQFKNMFDEKRRETSTVYLGCLVSTLVVVFLPLPSLIKLFTLVGLMLTQFCASCWYSLSYIPFGRRTALKVLRRITGLEEESASISNASYSNIFGGSNSGGV